MSDNVGASSRPWNVFFDAFATKEKMTLEDLTRRDISLYVRDKFETRRRSLQLRDEHENYDGLIQVCCTFASSSECGHLRFLGNCAPL